MKRFIFIFFCFLLSINIALAGELISEQTQDTTPSTTDLVLLEKADNSDFLYSTIAELMAVGNALTASALAANGANCNAGEYPLGVDAAGAVESCTDATTEIEAASINNIVEDTTPQLGGDLDLNGNNIDFPSTPNIDDVINDDSFATADDNNLPTADSVKTYVDTQDAALVTAVLDCSSGDCDDLVDAPAAFSDGDTTPDVSAGFSFITANTGATTINDFDTELTNGKLISVLVNDANTTFDFTSSGLEGTTADYTAADGELLIFQHSTADDQWHFLGFPKTLNNVTIAGFTGNRAMETTAGGALEVSATTDAELAYLDIASLGTGAVSKAVVLDGSGNYTAPAGTWAMQGVTAMTEPALTPVTDDADDFDNTGPDIFAGNNLYGGTFIADGAGTVNLPVMAVGMNFCVITLGAIAVVIDTHTDDGYLMDGVTGTEGKILTNLSTAGDIACLQYYTADDWLITTNGWTAE